METECKIADVLQSGCLQGAILTTNIYLHVQLCCGLNLLMPLYAYILLFFVLLFFFYILCTFIKLMYHISIICIFKILKEAIQ